MNTAVKTQTEQQSIMVKKKNKKKSILILKKRLVATKVIRDWNFRIKKMNSTCIEKNQIN